MLKPSLNTHNLGASPGPRAQVTHHQIEKNYIARKSPLWKRKKKKEVVVFEEGYPKNEDAKVPSTVHIYKLIEL